MPMGKEYIKMNMILGFLTFLILCLFGSVAATILRVFRTPGRGRSPKAYGDTYRVIGVGLGRFRTTDAISNNSIPSAQAYTYQAPAGVPGDITRPDETNTEPAMLIADGSSVFAQAFGLAMVYNTGGITQAESGFAAADFAGVLVRQAPGISDSGDGLTGNIPNAVQVQALCVRGYINVYCGYGTPARGGVVYVRVVANSNNENVGTFDATSDSSNNVALSSTQASWASDGKDGNNNAELRIAR